MSKVILITGAPSGMGKETGKQLIAEGHIVYAVARRIDNMLDLKESGGNTNTDGYQERSRHSKSGKHLS